ncbi:hypothetical protein HUJ05_012713 [Dendroctonus ponderosae]|nr:hypothetical protein HUJ05_012713 [Dendroctonus ponderosae]
MEQMQIEEPGPEEATGQDVALLARYKRICSIGYKWQMVIIISFVVLLAAGMYMIVKKSNTRSTQSRTPHNKPDMAFLEALDYITGGWPKKHTNMKSVTWWDVMLKSRQIGMNFDFFLNVNITEFPNPHFQISPPDVDLMILFHKLWMPRHKGYIRKIVEYWGYTDASLFWEFEETRKFANTLMEAVLGSYLDVHEIDVNSIRLPKISDLVKTRDSDPDWLPFLQNITGVADLKETELVSFKIRSDSHENYLSRLATLIETTPTRLWMNYVIAYHIVREYKYLSRTVQIVINKIMDVEEDSSRHDFCIFETGKYFHADIEKVLVNQIVTPDKIKNIRNMYNYITKALEGHLKQAYASNDIVREGSIRQLKNMSLHVGGNDYFFNDKLFDETFGIKPDDLSDNAIDSLHVLEKFRVDDILSLIRRPSAFYNRSLDIEDIALTYTRDNSLYLLAPVLRDPTYSLNRPEYINYGSLGTMIAHELMRMYDDRIFDRISSDTLPVWQAEMKKDMENSLVCVNQSYIDYYQKQFNTSNIPSVDLEGPILDYGSANIAYLAYLDYVNASGTEHNIVGVPYDPYQVFWIMASTFFCNIQKLEESEDAWNGDFRMFQLPSYRFFSTCMKIRNAEGTNMAFLNAVEYITGGWPKDFENVKHQSWWDLMLKSREMGMQFDFFLDVNIAEFPHAYLQIGPPELNKFRFYNKMWDIPQTVVYIEDIARHWGHTESSLFFENDGTLEFAKKLRDLVESCYKNSCVTIPKVATKISNLEKSRDSDSDWLPFLTNLTGIEDLNENDLVYFKMETNPKDNYISKLNELLESTPTRHWLNYIIIYHVVRNYQYLSTQFQFYVSEMGFEFLEESSDRQEFCLSEIGKYYRKDVEQGANHLVTDEEEQQIRTMYNYTHKALTERLRIEFKDNKSLREGSLKLLKNIRLYIGASEHFFEDDPFSDALANKSEELSDNAIEMIHNLERKRMDHIFGLIRKPKGNYSRILEIGANTFTYSVDDSLYLKGPPAQCQTAECIKAANYIISYINQTADPCEDFYKFACGNFHKNNMAMETKNVLDQMDVTKRQTLDQLLIGDYIDDSKFSGNLQLARKFYKKCTNITAINEDKDETFLEIMLKVVGGICRKPLWQNVAVNARKNGMNFNFFLNVSVTQAQNKYMLLIAPPSIKHDWFDLLSRYNNIEHIKKIAQHWISDDIAEWFLADPEKILDFAMQFHQETSSNTLIEMYFNIRKVQIISNFNFTRQQLIQTYLDDNKMPSMETNIHFIPNQSHIYVLAPILQYPIYDRNWPQYLNYGALGTMIAHKLIQAVLYPDIIFDDKRLMKSGLQPDIIKHLLNFKNCIYNDYTRHFSTDDMPKEIVLFCLEESYADFASINTAYKAYKHWVQEHGSEDTLPGDVEKPAQCQTVECIQAANHILSYINQTADPCDDFYKFTCGKFHEGNIAMEKKTFLDEMDENIQKIQDQLLTSVNIDDSKFNTNLQVARSFYKVCINKAAVNQDKDRTYVDTMLKLVSDAGDKPLWQNVTLNARKYGIDYDFFLNVSVAWIPKTHLLMIAPPYISPHWFKMLWQSNNTEYIKKVAQYWMSDYIPQWFLADPDKIVDFANQFQKIVLESTPVASNVRQKIRPISELKQTDYFNRDWLVFLRELTGIESFEDSDEVLYLIDNGNTDNYLSKLHDLMERTHWSVWANYMIIMNTAQLSGLLSSPVQHIFEELIPNFVETAKTESCKDLTQIMFPGAQETEYIKMLMNTKKQKHVQAIMDKLKLVMVNSIKDILSVNHSSTDVVLDELRNIASVIGSDSNLHNSSDHAQNGAQYGKEIVSNSLIDMYFKIKKVEISYFFNYTQMENQADVRNPIMSISMYYVREENTIYVPAPVLQRPIYDTNWPQYLNYGALGAMIGHELMHALLTTYIALDVDPNNQTGYTIGEETEEFGSCEYDKYLEYLTERYFPTNITADTLHESMADFGGQNLAYKSYQSWVKEHGLEPELPGVNYTANQIFWIMSSIHLCHDANLEHPDKMQEYLTSEIAYYYPVPSYRVNGPKVNSPSFAKDFSCQRNAKMNPNNK